jgi:hypothetical protein
VPEEPPVPGATVEYAFVGTLEATVQTSGYSGTAVLIDRIHAWWVLVVRVDKVKQGDPPVHDDNKIAFLVHSPSKVLYGGNSEPGARYRFTVWRKDAEEGEVHRYLEVAPPSGW